VTLIKNVIHVFTFISQSKSWLEIGSRCHGVTCFYICGLMCFYVVLSAFIKSSVIFLIDFNQSTFRAKHISKWDYSKSCSRANRSRSSCRHSVHPNVWPFRLSNYADRLLFWLHLSYLELFDIMRERVSPVKPAKIPSKRGSVKTSATGNSNGTSQKSGCGVKSDPTCVDCCANIGDNVRALQCDTIRYDRRD